VYRAALVALFAQCALVLAHSAHAGTWEQLLMPGPVIAGHAKFEQECTKCHEQFEKGSQKAQCLACHEEIGADIEATMGYHGRSPVVKARECRHCHTDHKGRDEDIVRLDSETFDHAYTDFTLRGAHARLTCDSCHRADAPYRKAPRECAGCHESTDVHGGKLGTACKDCHRETTWSETTFDHAHTKFALSGKHADVACLQCHTDRTFQGAPLRCVSCHRLNDVHAGGYGEDCARCHDASGWRRVGFDHERDARFALRGRHAQINCTACHRPGADPRAAERECVACHRKDDAHRGRYGADCRKCHGQARWSEARFDHDSKSSFPLKGRHAEVPCLACHTEAAASGSSARSCVDCHGVDDVHRGELGKGCGDCHGVDDWTQARFDHDLTRFPLIGLHALAPCEDCHRSSRFNDAGSACIDCHAPDDSHEGRLGRDCGQCHNPNGWKRWVFDHATQTGYPLDGAHRTIACERCHRTAGGDLKLPQECVACHAAQDAHDGRFGPVCGRCHVTSSFRDVQIGGRRR
jgi:hypothetical protein